ncbi:TIGR02302 family protein [Flavimaricola marinus]|uniref:TIGR02302 family protein n=1 Tax=Flavimaricola marinus TaxID=1819565 RepID=A0A238LCZ2_9RHOB|nr:TIGR02302 family protein [Flavimaricola marinus]SMY06806.1 hypothetical protein LOM8899_00936 [Flavimaricola marinus]
MPRPTGPEPLPHLNWPVRLTRAGMLAEAVVRAFWPLWIVIALILVPLLMGWLRLLTEQGLWAFVAVAGLAFLAAFGWGLRKMVWPSRADALARLDATLPGRPIAALADSQAIGAGDLASEAVWRAHLARMAERTREARAVQPDLRISDRDPYGLRFIAALFLAVAVLFGGAFRAIPGIETTADGQVLATGPVWEGWVEPPAYTGRPSLYLADIPPGLLIVPQGSRVTLRLYGEPGALTVTESITDAPIAPDPEAEPQSQRMLEVAQNGNLTIDGPGGAAWDVRIIADVPPEVSITAPVEASAMGEMSLPFAAQDDYAVMAGQAVIALDLAAVERAHGLTVDPDPRDPVIVDLPMPFSGDRGEFQETLIDDFSQHPFANMPVTVTMSVTDAAGQEGIGIPEGMILPGRRFFQPVARAVIEQRRDLLWSASNARRVVQVLRAVSYKPEDLFTSETTYLRLNVTLRRLDALSRAEALTAEEVDEIALALWDLAIQLEDGTLADARERLQRAQERLAEAMRNGASDEEIAELMNELREAMNDYMNMLAQNAEPRDGTDEPQTGENSTTITQDELQALMDRIQELMEEGRMAEAAELMEQLNQLMENLQVTQGEGGEGGPQTPGQQSMQDMAEALRDQQQLSDEAFRELQEQFNGQQPGQQQGQQGQEPGQQQGQQGQQPGQQPGSQQGQGQSPGEPSGQGQQNDQGPGGDGGGDQQNMGSLSERQEALRREVERQRGNLPALSGEEAEAARRALDQAEGAMEEAEDALREGDMAEAIDRQAEAMNALREGMRNLGEALAQNENQEPGQGTQQGAADGRVEPTRRDPLGRQLGNNGQFGSDENMLQGNDVYRRAEELLDEIRRRSAEQERPEQELDYLKRLLERF